MMIAVNIATIGVTKTLGLLGQRPKPENIAGLRILEVGLTVPLFAAAAEVASFQQVSVRAQVRGVVLQHKIAVRQHVRAVRNT